MANDYVDFMIETNKYVNDHWDYSACSLCGGTGYEPVICCNGQDCNCNGIPVDFKTRCSKCGIMAPPIKSDNNSISESQRLLIAANKAKERLHEWFCSARIWASTNPDSIKYQLHTGSSTESMKFDTLEALEEWVDSLSLGGNREIIHRKFKL